LQKQGSWVSYQDTKLGQGREGAIAFLKQNPKLLLEIEEKTRRQAAEAT
jgi:recombination protein RecA